MRIDAAYHGRSVARRAAALIVDYALDLAILVAMTFLVVQW